MYTTPPREGGGVTNRLKKKKKTDKEQSQNQKDTSFEIHRNRMKEGVHFSEDGTHGKQSNVDIDIHRDFPFHWTRMLRRFIIVTNTNKTRNLRDPRKIKARWNRRRRGH